jgi:sugar phosphate permease
LLGERFRPAQLAAANAAFVMMYEVGSITGPVVSGLALDQWPALGLPIAVGIVAALFVVIAAAQRPAR